MLIAIGTLILLAIIFGPQLWTRYIFRRYSAELTELPGTGGELAGHLLERLGIPNVKVEETKPDQDHYDPEERVIRLSPDVHNGRSLTAVVIAAHETGHALQHHLAYRPLYLRWRMARYVALAEKLAGVMLLFSPVIAILTRMPHIGGLTLLVGITILIMPVIFHLVTLPVELDASFGRAMPILNEGNYLPPSAIPIARRILTAAALTYVAASLASILNFYRWLIFLRR